MNVVSMILTAMALSMDSFAVSIVNGLSFQKTSLKSYLQIAFTFAFFHTLMPLIGYFVGIGFEKIISDIDHWIAFVLLGLLGLKMVYEGLRKEQPQQKSTIQKSLLISQAFATTIDAFVIGISFALLNYPILFPILTIGVVTFVCSIIGLFFGKYFGKKMGYTAEILGGIILFGLGCKILIEHLYF